MLLPHRRGYCESFGTLRAWAGLSSNVPDTRALVGWRNAGAGLGNSWGGRGFPGDRSIITCNATKSQLSGELGVQNGAVA